MARNKGGRIPKNDKADVRYSVNLTAVENAKFQTMYELSGVNSKARFIKARIFNDSFRVIQIDRAQLDYYQKLTALFGHFRSIGVNYNQAVAALHSHFTEQRAYIMVKKLEDMTIELAHVGKEIVRLTNEFRASTEASPKPQNIAIK